MKLGQGLSNAATDQSFNGADHVLVSPGVQLCGYSSTQGFPSDHQFLKMDLSLADDSRSAKEGPPLPLAASAPLLPPAPPGAKSQHEHAAAGTSHATASPLDLQSTQNKDC